MTATGLPRRAVCPTCLRRYEPPPAAARCHDDGQPLLPLGEADGDPRIGTIAGERYLLLDVLGEGGMGVVYLAWQLQMARYVALKTLHPTGPNRDGLERRFLREVRATASLRSPHTLTVFDSGKLPSGDLYLAMERLHGAPLDRLLRLEGKLSPALARLVGLHVCRSLSEAHGAGIVHRDIKPANLVLERLPSGEPHVKVLDFGIAKLLDDASTDLTSTGSTLGSIAYMSPEQIDGREIGPAADLYALGATLFELMTDALPFEATTRVALMFKHLSEAPPSLVPRLGASPAVAALDAIIRRCLAKTPEERYPSADALYAALTAVPVGEEPVAAVVATAVAPPTAQPVEARERAFAETLEDTDRGGSDASSAPTDPSAREEPVAAAPLPTAPPPVAPPVTRRARWVIPAVLAAGLLAFIVLDALRGGSGGERPAPAAAGDSARAVVTTVAPPIATAGLEVAVRDVREAPPADVEAVADAEPGDVAEERDAAGPVAAAIIAADTVSSAPSAPPRASAPVASVTRAEPAAARAVGSSLLAELRRCYRLTEKAQRTLQPVILWSGAGKVTFRVANPENAAFAACAQGKVAAASYPPPEGAALRGFLHFRVAPPP